MAATSQSTTRPRLDRLLKEELQRIENRGPLERDLARIARALERIADALERTPPRERIANRR